MLFLPRSGIALEIILPIRHIAHIKALNNVKGQIAHKPHWQRYSIKQSVERHFIALNKF